MQRLALVLSLCFWFALLAVAQAAAPTAFNQPYHDGAVVALWQDGYTSAQIDAIIARAVQAGVRSIEVPIFGCQTDIHSADVGACDLGLRTQPMLVVERAAAAGLNVSVLPIIATPKWDWRGTFDPTDVDGWFASYEAWLIQLAKDVRAAGATELIAGSEFKILYQYSDQWSQLLHDLRSVFTGPLIVTANWDNLDYDFWPDSDAVGISVYYPLASAGATPSQSDLNTAWAKRKAQLLSTAKKWSRPLYFTEIGYNNTASTAATPWGPPTGGSPEDLTLQAECFTAMQSAWASEKNLVRLNVWAISDPILEGSSQLSFDFLGSPSESILSAFYAARAALP